MLEAGLLRRVGHRLRLLAFPIDGQVLPKIGDAERGVGAMKRLVERRWMICVAGDYIDTQSGKRLRFVGIRLARDRARPELAVLVRSDRSRETSALRACGSDDGNDLFV